MASPVHSTVLPDLNWASAVDDPWTIAELTTLLRKTAAKGSAPGLTGMSNRLLRDAPPLVHQAILSMFETMRQHRVIPPSLGLGLLCPLRKDPNLPALPDSRPVTLLEDLIKVYTKGLNDRVQQAMAAHAQQYPDHPVMSALQRGNTRNVQALNAIWPVLHTIEHAKTTKNELHIMSIDVRRAYDSVEFWSSELAMRRLHLPEGFIQIMREMDRVSQSCINNPTQHTEFYDLERGMRQGDSLSPLRFVFWMDIILTEWANAPDPYKFTPNQDDHVSGFGWVDDTLPISSTAAGAQNRLDTYAAFLRAHRVTLKLSKTYHVRLNAPDDPPMQVAYWDHDTGTVQNAIVKIRSPDAPWTYLGVTFTLAAGFTAQWTLLTASLKRKLRALYSTRLSSELHVEGFNLQLVPSIAWAAALTFPPQSILSQWDRMSQDAYRARFTLACHPQRRLSLARAADAAAVPPPPHCLDESNLSYEAQGSNLHLLTEHIPALSLRHLQVALHSSDPLLQRITRAAWAASATIAPRRTVPPSYPITHSPHYSNA